MRREEPITVLKGVGAKSAERFAAAGIETVGDLLDHYPTRYEKYDPPADAGSCADGQIVAVCGFVDRKPVVRRGGRTTVTTAKIITEEGPLQAMWFNMPYLRSTLTLGIRRVYRGRIRVRGRSRVLQQPQVFDPEEYAGKCAVLQPVYPLVSGLTNNALRKAIRQALEGVYGLEEHFGAADPGGTPATKTLPAADGIVNPLREAGHPDGSRDSAPTPGSVPAADGIGRPLREAGHPDSSRDSAQDADYPEEFRRKYHLPDMSSTAWGMHFPPDEEAMRRARGRLAFDEFLLFLLTLRMLQDRDAQVVSRHVLPPAKEADILITSLPYELTGAQKKAWADIRSDLAGTGRMNRLIQGDVGSGKTILAFLAMVTAAGNGKQSALMAPTEVLARQHYENFQRLCENAGLSIPAVLLTGSMTAKEKREAHRLAASGEALVFIGTHALIQDSVRFSDLALVVTDEQHRFGVAQRERLGLAEEAEDLPHTIVMSATPIPRSLAVILFGDMDVTVLDEMPADRIPIRNCVVTRSWRPNAWNFIRRETAAGHQAYVICPLVDGSELIDAENVTEYTDLLREAFGGDLCVEMLHGRMKSTEKNRVMDDFAAGQIQVLVSTTVIEVGVDVPNATVMMIENAERFGLAQLHQLRGRVGRGGFQSYCIFLCGQENRDSLDRLEILGKSNDGFEIARKDLGMRGPGDLLGVKQSGEAPFDVADIYRDADILMQAKDASDQISDIMLMNPTGDYDFLHSKLLSYQKNKQKNLNI